MESNLHDITDENIISRAENEISLEFLIPESSDFFDGHFPEYKLLPAEPLFRSIFAQIFRYTKVRSFNPPHKIFRSDKTGYKNPS